MHQFSVEEHELLHIETPARRIFYLRMGSGFQGTSHSFKALETANLEGVCLPLSESSCFTTLKKVMPADIHAKYGIVHHYDKHP